MNDAHAIENALTGWTALALSREEAERTARQWSTQAPQLAYGSGYCSLWDRGRWQVTVGGVGSRGRVLRRLENLFPAREGDRRGGGEVGLRDN